MSYLSDMDDIDMTCSDFVNPLKMLICSEKQAVSGANHDYTKQDAREAMRVVFFCTYKMYLYAQNEISYEYVQILF